MACQCGSIKNAGTWLQVNINLNNCKCQQLKMIFCKNSSTHWIAVYYIFYHVAFIFLHFLLMSAHVVSIINVNILKCHFQFCCKKCVYYQHLGLLTKMMILYFESANLLLRAERQWTQLGNFIVEFVLRYFKQTVDNRE